MLCSSILKNTDVIDVEFRIVRMARNIKDGSFKPKKNRGGRNPIFTAENIVGMKEDLHCRFVISIEIEKRIAQVAARKKKFMLHETKSKHY